VITNTYYSSGKILPGKIWVRVRVRVRITKIFNTVQRHVVSFLYRYILPFAMSKRTAEEAFNEPLAPPLPAPKIFRVDLLSSENQKLRDECSTLRYKYWAVKEEVDYWKRMYQASMHSALWRKNRGITLHDLDDIDEATESEVDSETKELIEVDTDSDSEPEFSAALDKVFEDFIA